MWPKVIAQLFELLPHITRLVPMADKFFSQKAATERANEAALVAMAEGVRGDLGQVTKAHAGLYRQLQELGAQVDVVGGEAKQARMAAESLEARLSGLEKALATQRVVSVVGLVLLVAALIEIAVLRGR
jgi:chromosome segregation ATPase